MNRKAPDVPAGPGESVAPKKPMSPRRIVALAGTLAGMVMLIVGGSIAGSYALTLHQIRVNDAAQATAQHQQAQEKAAAQRQQAIAGCRQFDALVVSIVAANSQSKHAVAAHESFGQLFSQ